MPAIEVGGKFFVQTDAIMRLLGRKYGYYPSDPEVAYLIDSFIDGLKDFVSKVYAVHFEKDEEKKKQLGEKVFGTDFPKFLEFVTKRYEANGKTGFLVGDKITIADFYLGTLLSWFVYNEE